MWAGWPDINGCHFDVYVVGKYQGKSSVSFMAVASLSEGSKLKAHRYACNCGIRRRSALYLIRRRAQRTLGPFRTNKRETDWLTERERETDCLVALGMVARCSYCSTLHKTWTNTPTYRYNASHRIWLCMWWCMGWCPEVLQTPCFHTWQKAHTLFYFGLWTHFGQLIWAAVWHFNQQQQLLVLVSTLSFANNPRIK